jgi:hypothetical protein
MAVQRARLDTAEVLMKGLFSGPDQKSTADFCGCCDLKKICGGLSKLIYWTECVGISVRTSTAPRHKRLLLLQNLGSKALGMSIHLP